MARYTRAPKVVYKAFHWDVCYHHRRKRIAQLMYKNAPQNILEKECLLFLEACAQSSKLRVVIWRLLKQSFSYWWYGVKFSIEWYWYRLWHSQQETEDYFFGDTEIENKFKQMDLMEGKSNAGNKSERLQ